MPAEQEGHDGRDEQREPEARHALRGGPDDCHEHNEEPERERHRTRPAVVAAGVVVPVVSRNRIGANMFIILTESARGVGVPRRLGPARLARGRGCVRLAR